MKSKIYSFVMVLFLFAGFLKAQTNTILYNGFDGYNGLPPTVASGWYYSLNDSSSTNRSFYTSSGTCGDSIPAYKFGLDSITVISPAFVQADSLRFWMKGNGTVHDSNTFEVYVSDDSLVWNVLTSIDSISASGKVLSFPVANSVKYVKFFFRKFIPGYNVGLDDIALLKISGTGIIKNHDKSEMDIYPSPTSGMVNIFIADAKTVDIRLYDLLGNELKNIVPGKISDKKIVINLAGRKPGFYFIRIQTENSIVTKRVTLQ